MKRGEDVHDPWRRLVGVLETLGGVLRVLQSIQKLLTTTQTPVNSRSRRVLELGYFQERVTLTRSVKNKVETIAKKAQNITRRYPKDGGTAMLEPT